MKIGMCIGGFDKKQLEKAKKAKFDFSEACFSEMACKSDSEMKEYLDYLKELDFVPIAANGFFKSGLMPFFDRRFDIGEIREYIAMAFEKTKDIRFESISFGSGQMRNIPNDYEYDKAFDFAASLIHEEIVPYLEKYDARLNVEELQTKETNFLNTCAETARFVKKINSKRVGLLCDFYHMSFAGETGSDLPKFFDTVGHVHIASPLNKRAVPLENDGDNEKYELFFDNLKKLGYNRLVSIEGGVASGDFGEVLADAYKYINKIINNK